MNNKTRLGDAAVSPELLALYSIAQGCSSADRDIGKLALRLNADQRMAFLQESIFFHHFMAIAAAFHVFRELAPRRAYCDAMVAAIKPGKAILPNEELGLPPATVFSANDREEAVRRCFFALPAMTVGSAQELYLQNKPSEAELKVMNLRTIREMTGADRPGRTAVQCFTAAFLARLSLALSIDPESHTLDFLKLSSYSAAASRAAFELYIEILGAEVVTKEEHSLPQGPREPKRKWLSRLFK